MRCLFLPDNLFASIIEEQTLFSHIASKPFRKIFPIFKTNSHFDSLTIYPPIALKGFIVRLCNVSPSSIISTQEKLEGFILGYAGEEAQSLIREIPSLKTLTKNNTFNTISAKSWYFADVQYKKIKGNLIWSVSEKQWEKKCL